MKKLKLIYNFISNMGLRYIAYRLYHEIMVRTGLFKLKFPTNPKKINSISLREWRNNTPNFFFHGKAISGLKKNKDVALKEKYEQIKNGIFTYFSKTEYELGQDYDWLTNPETGYNYSTDKHWSKIEDLSEKAGDIKFVWEKARFSFLMDIIRFDYHFEKDCSAYVFKEIESFIDKNPINLGPNYKCSQETSLRLLNWCFALYYYKDSENLNELLFSKVLNSIYWQIHHIYNNIHFSRIAVRNNHALTETLLLYTAGILFPFFPNVKKWSSKGKKWFEKEIDYQIYNDGTFLQYSMNYHRVAVQLLTWGIRLSKLNNLELDFVVYKKAKKSLSFLDTCFDVDSGQLPNYGSNDGALFFKLTSDDYRKYTSQLNDLRMVLFDYSYDESESLHWLGFSEPEIKKRNLNKSMSIFSNGGYYIIQEEGVKTFIKCGSYKDRPGQSDNLHVDIWINGENILRDSGTYKYNTTNELKKYFNGCGGHNTVSVNNADQMLKGSRFIWYYWVKNAVARLYDTNKNYIFEGSINAFKNEGKKILHNRTIKKEKRSLTWEVLDLIQNKGNKQLQVFWHLNPKLEDKIQIDCESIEGEKLSPIIEKKWFSGYYGYKEESTRMSFMTYGNGFKTIIKVK